MTARLMFLLNFSVFQSTNPSVMLGQKPRQSLGVEHQTAIGDRLCPSIHANTTSVEFA